MRELVAKTNCYPRENHNAALILGVANELLEYLENEELSELGDVIWYMTACEYDITGKVMGTLSLDLVKPLEVCSKLVGCVKKHFRKDEAYKNLWTSATPWLNIVAEALNNMSFIIIENAVAEVKEKLERRLAADTLRGDGDR